MTDPAGGIFRLRKHMPSGRMAVWIRAWEEKGMDELKAVFAANLIRLRNGANMTQAELGEKLHYTDKAVSKWERAESVPDAMALQSLAGIFGVTVDALLTEPERWEPPPTLRSETETYSRLFIILCSIASIWTLCVIEFVVVWIVLDTIQWIVFVIAVPLSLTALLIFNSIWYRGKNNMYIVGALVLSLVAMIYLVLLKYNFWQMFLILIPAELVVFLAFHIPAPRNKKEHSTGGRE